MVLGDNLKKKKLIESEPKTRKKSATDKKKKVMINKKELIKKPAATKSAKKNFARKKKITSETKQQKIIDTKLPIYIAQELHKLKINLRRRYKEEVAKLHGSIIQFVVMVIGGESYAVDINCVKEVVSTPVLSKTPNTPSHIRGIANVRGNIYIVYDLAKKFKVSSGDSVNSAKYLIVINREGIVASLILDLLPATFKVNGSNISSSLNMIEDASLDASYIKGLIQHEDQLIYYLDIIELLKNDKAIVIPDKLGKSNK